MHIAHGDHRRVIAIPRFGIVIKLPQKTADHQKETRKKEWRHFLRELLLPLRKPSVLRHPYGAWIHWVRIGARYVWAANCACSFWCGIVENWSEFCFYRRATTLESMLLVPTYLSLFGLCNIQRYAKPCVLEWRVVSRLFDRLIGDHTHADGHHFQNPGNFTGLERGYVTMLDYGSSKVQRILSEQAPALLQPFDVRTLK